MFIKASYKLLVILALINLWGCQSDQEKAVEYLESAQNYFDNGEYSLASVELKNAIKKDTSLAEAYFLHADIFEKNRDWEKMHAFLATGLQHQPEHLEANLKIAKLYAKGKNLKLGQEHLDIATKAGADKFQQHLVQGMLYMHTNKIQKAMIEANAALAIDNSSVEASILAISLNNALRNYRESLAIYRTAIAANPDSEKLLVIGSKIYTVLKDFEAATDNARRLIQLFPEQLNYFYLLAALQDQSGDSDAAEQTLRLAVSSNPTRQEPKIALAGYISAQAKTQKAIQLLKSFIESDTDSDNKEMQLILAELYQEQGELKEAEKIYTSLSTSSSQSANTAKNKLALLALKENRKEDALAILNEVLKSDFNNTEALITRAIIYSSNQNLTIAISDLLSAIRNEPDSELALVLLTRAYRRNNELSLATQTAAKLFRLDPADAERTLLYCDLLFEDYNYQLAINILKEHIEAVSPSRQIKQKLLDAYLANNNWEQARALAAQIAATSNQPEFVDYIDARILKLKGNFDGSIAKYKQLLKQRLYIGQALRDIVSSYRAQQKSPQAIEFLKRYIANYPNDLYSVELLATEYLKDKRIAQAETLLLDVLKKNPKWPEGNLLAAKVYVIQNQWQSAINYGLKANDYFNNAEPVELLLLLASSYEQAGGHQQAENYYRQTLKRAPHIDSIANNLALLIAKNAKNRQDLDEALSIAIRFEKSAQPIFIDTLGWIYYLAGDYQQSAVLLEKAIYIDPGKAIFHYHLAAALVKLNEYDKARNHLQQSIKLSKKQGKFDGYDKAVALLASISETTR